MEFPERQYEAPKVNFLEVSLEAEKENDYTRLEEWLVPLIGKEEGEQCVFVLRGMESMSFINQCDEAVKEFGKRLNEQFGGEESFFELVPHARYSDVRSDKSLDKVGYVCDHHDVGLLEFAPEGKEKFSIIFDLSYGDVMREGRRKAVAAYSFSGDRRQATEMLKNKYGGAWKIKFELNKESGNFIYQDN